MKKKKDQMNLKKSSPETATGIKNNRLVLLKKNSVTIIWASFVFQKLYKKQFCHLPPWSIFNADNLKLIPSYLLSESHMVQYLNLFRVLKKMVLPFYN